MVRVQGSPANDYAIGVADESYRWYDTAATRSKRLYRLTEYVTIVAGALIPLSVAIFPTIGLLPALLGSIIVIATGLRANFHWHENYLRFSRAREAVEAERRRYRSQTPPYENNETRDRKLLELITKIEQDEMSQWITMAESTKKIET